jgi:AcrR family transcriptional regulator
MVPAPTRSPRSAKDTRARIIAAAQQVFADKGYAQGSLREIARRADVAVSLLIKYFSTKANLFHQALGKALIDPQVFQADRARFGHAMIAAMRDRDLSALAPAMIALSISDQEAREIVVKVAREAILEPMTDWLGQPDAAARANYILMLTTGFLLFGHHVTIDESDDAARATADFVARALQAAVDN